MSMSLPAPDALQQMPAPELTQLFRSLDAPDMEEMNGEFSPVLLRQWHPMLNWMAQQMMNTSLLPIRWTGKAFRPVSATEGRGYNIFRVAGRSIRTLPMKTVLAPSALDGRPSYQLVYAAFHSPLGYIRVVDELRRFAPGVYLGIGAAGFAQWQRRVPFPFLLQGPVAPYQRDVGWPRRRFDIARALNHDDFDVSPP